MTAPARRAMVRRVGGVKASGVRDPQCVVHSTPMS
jgi:hypothetical protein